MIGQLILERRALSLFLLGFFATVFFLFALSVGDAWATCFYALGAVYALGFFALAAEWFWGRWYVLGLGVSGMTLSLLGLVTGGWNPGLAIWGGLHLAIYAPLMGETMAERYENLDILKERYGLDEYGVARLKRAVKSAATALPTLIFYTLAPKHHQLSDFFLLLTVGVGFYGLLRMRFWGVMVLALATLWTAISTVQMSSGAYPNAGSPLGFIALGGFALLCLVMSISPFIVPAYRFLRDD